MSSNRNPKFVFINPYLLYYISTTLFSMYMYLSKLTWIICVLLHSQKSKTVLHNTILESEIHLQHLSQFSCIYQNLHRNFVLLHSQKSKICVHKSIFTVLQNTSINFSQILLHSQKSKICVHKSIFTVLQNTSPHFSQCTCIYQNLHRNFVLLHSQKSKICMHKSIFTVLHTTLIRIRNTSTTPFSIFMYLSKLTQKLCTSAFTEIQNLCS